jgi:hypothetical protein
MDERFVYEGAGEPARRLARVFDGREKGREVGEGVEPVLELDLSGSRRCYRTRSGTARTLRCEVRLTVDVLACPRGESGGKSGGNGYAHAADGELGTDNCGGDNGVEEPVRVPPLD